MLSLNKIVVTSLILFLMLGCDTTEDAAHIQIGTSNDLFRYTNTQYQKEVVIQITDIDGNPVEGGEVDVKVTPIEYRKGVYIWLDADDVKTSSLDEAVKWSVDYPTSILCAAEDLDLDGVLDAGEDVNGSTMLEPSNVASISAHPIDTPTIDLVTNKIVTNELGFGYFTIIYPESEANWATVRVAATVDVSGTESIQILDVDLSALLTDMEEVEVSPVGGSVYSPYGFAGVCSNPD